ncbi:MAG: hypothetical protein SXA11_12045 [Cyanobacteriota bacterium]|nr:hypothetical protein [Cyanobacteriota bacterium]
MHIEPAYHDGNRLFINGQLITKKDAKQKCQQLLKIHQELEGEDLIFVASILLSWRSNYQTPVRIKVDLAPDGYCNCFYYFNQLDSWEDFSYYKPLKKPEANAKCNLQEAFRCEVSKQISDFRSSHQLISHKNIHVDHIIPFQKLLQDFLAKYNLHWRDIKLEKVPARTIQFKFDRYQIKNRKLAKAWQDFHQKNAELQILSAKENLQKSSVYNQKRVSGFVNKSTNSFGNTAKGSMNILIFLPQNILLLLLWYFFYTTLEN